MSITAYSGPLITFGADPFGDANPEQGASIIQSGVALADLRTAYRYRPGSVHAAYGWSAGSHLVVDAVPSAISAVNIAAAQVPVAGTALTLVSTTGAGITVGVGITRADTGAAVTGLLAIDGAMGTIDNSRSTIKLWDPSKALSRVVRITSVGNDSGATFAVRGYDIYGFPMTETITGANATVATGVKCFKYISSITPAGTLAGANVTVGTGDVFGFPLQTLFAPYARIFWNNAIVTAVTGFTAAVVTDPATATTGDVRGKYAVQGAASNGTLRLVIEEWVPPSSLAAMNGAASIFGISQFADF
jgi:hypothetical protein